MIFDNIRRNTPGIFLLALLMVSLFWGEALLNPPDKIVWSNSVFSHLPESVPGILYVILGMVLTLISGFLIYRICSFHISTRGREHLHVWLWIIQIGAFTFMHSLTEVHIATVFVLLAYNRLFYINKKDYDYSGVFMSAMYLGLATLFYNLTIYLFIPYVLALYRFKPIGVRSWVIAILAFLTPYYFAVFVSFFTNGNWLYPIQTTIDNIVLHFPLQFTDLTIGQFVFCSLIAILVITSMFKSINTISSISQKTISCNISFSRLLFFSVLILLFFAPESKLILHIAFIATTILLRNLFIQIKKNWIANSLFAVIIIAAVISCILV